MKNLTKIIFAQIVITLLALCLLGQNANIQRAKYMTEKIGVRISESNSELQALHADIAALSSPQRITQIIGTLNLHEEEENVNRNQMASASAVSAEQNQLNTGEQASDKNAR